MKPSDARAGNIAGKSCDLDLEFPDGRTFISEPPHVSSEMLLKLSLPLVEANYNRPGAAEERKRGRCEAEFIL